MSKLIAVGLLAVAWGLTACGDDKGTGPEADNRAEGSSSDLVVESPWVSNSSPRAGASFTLKVTVRNLGNGQSGTTTLRYYLSTDTTFSTSDTQVDTDVVSVLAGSGTSTESIEVTAPSSAGTYYYGACVDTVSGESAPGNNCSPAVLVTVGESTGPTEPEPTTEDPAAAQTRATELFGKLVPVMQEGFLKLVVGGGTIEGEAGGATLDGDEWGFIDQDGNWVVQPRFERLRLGTTR